MKINAHTFVAGTNVTVCGKVFEPTVIDRFNDELAEHPDRYVWCSACGEPTPADTSPDLGYEPRCEADVAGGDVCLTRLPSWDAPCPNEFVHINAEVKS